MPTPLVDALRALADTGPVRFHMPGHKGLVMPLPEAAGAVCLDFTELPPTGNLLDGGGAIRRAEDLWAAAFSMERCQFLTGGSTLGLQTALALTCSPGDSVLLDRSCHRAVIHTAALLDLRPVWLERPWLPQGEVVGPVDPTAVEAALDAHPDIKTVCITSPTYYGVLSDLPAISHIVHRRGGKLVVDGAHGAHLPFLGDRRLEGADVLVVSAHKTLPALGQTAALLANGFAQEELCRWASLFSTTSPSYVFMASLDAARDWMEGEGRERLAAAAGAVAALRTAFPCLTPDHAPLDPCRLVLLAGDGAGAEAFLQQRNIWPEMSDRGHVVFIFTVADGREQWAALEGALAQLPPALLRPASPLPPPPPPEPPRLTPRQARFAPVERLPLWAAEGRTAAEPIAPYPPGIPVVAPGEVLTKKHLAYFSEIGYNREEKVGFISDQGDPAGLPTQRHIQGGTQL